MSFESSFQCFWLFLMGSSQQASALALVFMSIRA